MRNLVAVDWVAQAIVRLLHRPGCHGRTYHLVSPEPTPVRLIADVAVEVLGLAGVELVGGGEAETGRSFLDQLGQYGPYLQGDPAFDSRHLQAALPDWPAVRIDRAVLTRLFAFAVADRWGRRRGDQKAVGSRQKAVGSKQKAAEESCPPTAYSLLPSAFCVCRDYLETVFPAAAAGSALLRQAGLTVTVGVDVLGNGGGQWTYTWKAGTLVDVRAVLAADADVIYRTTPDAFADIVEGRRTPQEAFTSRRVDVAGDLEKAFKLSVLFGLFLRESAEPRPARKEAECAGVSV
jgi:hypothetical protein